MSRTAVFDDSVIEKAREKVRQSETARELRTGLTVILSARYKLTDEEIADALGVGVATISRLRKEMREEAQGKKREKKPRGGRRRETLSYEEEVAFLKPWEEKAKNGGVLVVSPIHAALEEKVGHPVALSTVYRMLARHGWRKVAPETHHPKRDAEKQEAFKKRASQPNWRKP